MPGPRAWARIRLRAPPEPRRPLMTPTELLAPRRLGRRRRRFHLSGVSRTPPSRCPLSRRCVAGVRARPPQPAGLAPDARLPARRSSPAREEHAQWDRRTGGPARGPRGPLHGSGGTEGAEDPRTRVAQGWGFGGEHCWTPGADARLRHWGGRERWHRPGLRLPRALDRRPLT